MKTILETEVYSRWIDSLRDKRAQLKIDIRVKRLAAGNPGDCKNVGNGVSELRIDYGPGYRVYFTQVDNVIVVLLIGGDKSSQRKDIEHAKELAKRVKTEGVDL